MSNKFLSSQGNNDILGFIKNNVSEVRSAVQLIPNANIQAYDATLQSLANLSTTSNKLIKSTGTDLFTTISISTHGETALTSAEPLITDTANAFTYSNLSGKPTIPTNVSELTNDANYITNTSNAFSYSNLSGTPTIPSNTSDLTNDSNFITNTSNAFSYSNLSGTPTIPSNTSDLTNDSNFITSIPTNLVTTNTNQDISGVKTLKNNLIIDDNNSGKLMFKKTKTLSPVTTFLQIQDHVANSLTDRIIYLPSINSGSTSDTLVGRDTTDTLTNKTLTSPTISTITNGSATLTLPTTSGTIALTSELGSGGISESDNLEFLGDFAINNYDVSNENELVLKGIGGGFVTNTAEDITFRNQADSNGGYFKMFSGSSGTAISIDANNKVGIGNTGAFSQLHIAKPSASTSISTAADFHLTLGRGEHGAGSYRLMGLGYVGSQASVPPTYIGFLTSNNAAATKGHLVFGTRNSTTNTVVPTERMRITDDGQVGIGGLPEYLLHVNGTLAIGTSFAWGEPLLKRNVGSTDFFSLGFSNGTSSGSTNVEQALNVLRTGRVGIGTTSPQCSLHVNSPIEESFRTQSAHSSGNGFGLIVRLDDISAYRYNSNSSTNLTGVGLFLSYYSNQSVFIGNPGTLVTSDDRLKHNEVDISNALQVINKLKPQKYYKSLKMYSESHNYELDNSGNPITEDDICLEAGLIAQDIQDIPELSYLVKVIPDKSYTKKEEIVDNSGNKQTKFIDVSVPSRLSLRYNDLFVYNLKATQELYKMVQDLQEEIKILKNNNV
eukprot:g8336.t1